MLQKLGFAPGINKQVTETGAESQWTILVSKILMYFFNNLDIITLWHLKK